MTQDKIQKILDGHDDDVVIEDLDPFDEEPNLVGGSRLGFFDEIDYENQPYTKTNFRKGRPTELGDNGYCRVTETMYESIKRLIDRMPKLGLDQKMPKHYQNLRELKARIDNFERPAIKREDAEEVKAFGDLVAQLDITRRIKEVCVLAGLSSAEAAKRFGLNEKQKQLLESGRSLAFNDDRMPKINPTIEALRKKYEIE